MSWRQSATLAAMAALALLTGCAIGPDYRRPDVALPAAYPDAAAGEAAPAEPVRADWWTLYGDTELNELVTAALAGNADLEKAMARVDEARAALVEVRSGLFPQLDLGAATSRSRVSTLNAQPLFAGAPAVSNSNRLALSTAFEVDLWGRIRHGSEAARAQLLGTRYAHDVTALSTAATTAQAYFLLRSLDARIAVTRRTLASREESLELVRRRVAGGLGAELAVNQAEAARADAALQHRELTRQRTLVAHHLAQLTGRPGQAIPPRDGPALPALVPPPAGLPSTLLERRPDVRAAEQALIAANARVGLAMASRFPTFSLTGDMGGQSEALADVLNPGARIWSLGLGATVPVLDAGRHRARTRQAEAVRRQAEADYRKTVETAFREVADALANVQAGAAAAADLAARAVATDNALRLARLNHEAGYAGYLEVLDAERGANAAMQALIQNQQERLGYSVDLMKALGGGWTPEAAP